MNTSDRLFAKSLNDSRDSALDFTKGALVILMVIYHWLNYFVSREGSFYKYLRFITPSFIFLSGFVIQAIYLRKYDAADSRLHRRLFGRGIRLLILFTVINLLTTTFVHNARDGVGDALGNFFDNLALTYLKGGGPADFPVLVPISYVLMCAPLLLTGAARSRFFLPIVTLFLIISCVMLTSLGSPMPYLELFSAGLFGMFAGSFSHERIAAFSKIFVIVVLFYAVYLVLLLRFNEIFVVQLLGVCANLLVIYSIGLRTSPKCKQDWITLLGKYSLLSYIAQIGILVVLSVIFTRFDFAKPGLWIVSFVLALSLTWASVLFVDVMRRRWGLLDRLYRFAFT